MTLLLWFDVEIAKTNIFFSFVSESNESYFGPYKIGSTVIIPKVRKEDIFKINNIFLISFKICFSNISF